LLLRISVPRLRMSRRICSRFSSTTSASPTSKRTWRTWSTSTQTVSRAAIGICMRRQASSRHTPFSFWAPAATETSADSDVDVCDNEGYSPLIVAVLNCDSKVINYLLDNGANINHLLDNGLSALMICVIRYYVSDKFIPNSALKHQDLVSL